MAEFVMVDLARCQMDLKIQQKSFSAGLALENFEQKWADYLMKFVVSQITEQASAGGAQQQHQDGFEEPSYPYFASHELKALPLIQVH